MSHRTGHVSASSRQGRPVERVQLGEYYRFIGQSHDDRLHEAGNLDGFTTALDGWASAILLQCDSNDPDPVRRIIEEKRFNADQLVSPCLFRNRNTYSADVGLTGVERRCYILSGA